MDDAEVKTRSKAVLEQNGVVMLSTVDADGRPRSRPMGALVAVEGESFAFHIMTGAQSRKVNELAANPQAQIVAWRPDWSETVFLSGTAALVDDDAVKDAVWEAVPGAHRYFGGRDDPNFAVLVFRTALLEYLDMQEDMVPFVVSI